jgi:uncharacterized membrane protein YkvA (DUF1232 family)
MKLIDRLKAKAKALKKEITVLYYAYFDPQTKLLPKIIILFTLGYALSPIDLIPDFIPILGYLDDLVILPALIALALKLISNEVIENARIKADEEPLRLKNNWLAAVIIIIIWIVVLVVLVRSIIGIFERRPAA